MQTRNLPSIDNRYWAAILIASVLGTTLGDYLSTGLNLGFLAGLAPMGLLLAFTLGAERYLKVSTVVYYWAAIVITRTAATNLADLATHSFKFGYGWVEAGLAAMLVITLLLRRAPAAPGPIKALPTTDCRYWVAILLASILGTTLGDFVSDGLKLGVGYGSLLLAAVLAVALYAQSKVKVPREVYYWLTIVLVRTLGTTMGDFASGANGLNLGFAVAAASMGVLLVTTLAFGSRIAAVAKPFLTFRAAGNGLKNTWKFRRPILAMLTIASGAGIFYGGYTLLNQASPQEDWYNKGALEIRKDFDAGHPWSSFNSPDVPYLQKSILYFNNQAEAGIIDRLLYGRPNVEYAAQAYLKVGVILLYNAGDDDKLLKEARDYLEKAVALNPGIPFAKELLADVSRTNLLAIMALAPERNLEMLYQDHPEQRSKKPDKSKKDGKGDQPGDKNGDQKGQPDQPNDQQGDNDKSKNKQQAPSSKNSNLQQNMQDVTNGQSNDGI